MRFPPTLWLTLGAVGMVMLGATILLFRQLPVADIVPIQPADDAPSGAPTQSAGDLSEVPLTYEQCTGTAFKGDIREATPLKCVYTVYWPEEGKIEQCKKIGGGLDYGYPGADPPQVEACKLHYYNPEYAFPTDFDQCVETIPVAYERAEAVDSGVCRTTVFSTSAAGNGPIAEQLIEQCRSAGGWYLSRETPRRSASCTAEFRRERHDKL